MRIQGNFGPRPERPAEIEVMQPFDDGINCPTCGTHHLVGLKEEQIVCPCGTRIHVLFAPCLCALMR